jgi:hypothetical protein
MGRLLVVVNCLRKSRLDNQELFECFITASIAGIFNNLKPPTTGEPP